MIVLRLLTFHVVLFALCADGFLPGQINRLTISSSLKRTHAVGTKAKSGVPARIGGNSLWCASAKHLSEYGLRKMAEDFDDAGESAEMLPLSSADMARLVEMRSRRETIPIMILDAMLPGQQLQFGSGDSKFRKLLEYVITEGNGEIGMIGFNPHSGRPLNMGVTLSVKKKNIEINPLNNMITLNAKGKRRFEVQGEPWMDDTQSFYLADVEIVDNREELISAEDERRAKDISERIPELVETWLQWVIQTGKSDLEGMEKRMKDIGPMPDEVGKRAIWVATLINPIPALGVCLEIRPAMLACHNDLDRMNLAHIGIQSSIDHLSGKRRLF